MLASTVSLALSSARGCIVTLHSERSPELPSGFVNWFGKFFSIADTHVLHHSSMDGYLFLRFLRVLCSICLTGVLITWPILLPIHATGGGGNTQFDLLSFSNVTKPNRYFAHALVACIFFSMCTGLPMQLHELTSFSGRLLRRHARELVLCQPTPGVSKFASLCPSDFIKNRPVHVCSGELQK